MKPAKLAQNALAATAIAVFAAVGMAQAGETSQSTPYPARPIPQEEAIPYRTHPVPRVATLPEDSGAIWNRSAGSLLVYRTATQIDAADRALATKSMPAIRDAAAEAGMEFGAASWNYRQLDCQAMPGHLFLLFTNDRGPGDRSLFTASIPRAGGGRVRIVPVERRGYSLFTPAPANALAIAAFNRIRAEEPQSRQADWLATSLCYAALTTPRSEIALSPRHARDANLALSFPPSLARGQEGASTVRFVNVAADSQAMQWALTFDAKGDLVHVDRFPAPVYATRIVPGK